MFDWALHFPCNLFCFKGLVLQRLFKIYKKFLLIGSTLELWNYLCREKVVLQFAFDALDFVEKQQMKEVENKLTSILQLKTIKLFIESYPENLLKSGALFRIVLRLNVSTYCTNFEFAIVLNFLLKREIF